MPLTPFDLTYVLYTERDALGKLCALLSLAPPFLLVSLATLLASRRDLGTLALLTGALLSAGAASALKKLFRQPRPTGFGLDHLPGYEHGMPSSHAVFCFFLAAYAAAWALGGRWKEPSAALRWGAAGGALAGAAAVAGARVYLHYHSPAQVGAGAGVGAAGGLLWHAATEALLRPHFAGVAASAAGRWLRLRDCSEVDVQRVEYEAVVRAAAGERGKGAARSE
jgi:dolichyldiphosphatase